MEGYLAVVHGEHKTTYGSQEGHISRFYLFVLFVCFLLFVFCCCIFFFFLLFFFFFFFFVFLFFFFFVFFFADFLIVGISLKYCEHSRNLN